MVVLGTPFCNRLATTCLDFSQISTVWPLDCAGVNSYKMVAGRRHLWFADNAESYCLEATFNQLAAHVTFF